MKKVVYSLTKVTKEGVQKETGIGFVINNDLLVAKISKKSNNAYIQVYESATKDCKQLEDNSYKGTFDQILNIENRTVVVDYMLWFKEVE